MTTGIVGKKLGMTQVFDAQGKVVPVTVIEAGARAPGPGKNKQSAGGGAAPIPPGRAARKSGSTSSGKGITWMSRDRRRDGDSREW